MAIRIRRGNQIDFDKNKLVAGELGLVLDAGEVYFCYSPGNTRKLQTAEDLQSLLNASPEAYQALQQLLSDLTADPNELVNILSNISALQSGKLDKTGDTKDNITTFDEAEEDVDIVTGEKHSTIFGKLLKSIKTLRHNIGVLASEKIDKSDIANNLVTTEAGLVLDARQGKVLDDKVNTINNNLANKTGKTYQGTISTDFKNTVQENWSSMPVGISLCLLAQSSLAGATVFKQGDSHGAVLIMPYTETNPIY